MLADNLALHHLRLIESLLAQKTITWKQLKLKPRIQTRTLQTSGWCCSGHVHLLYTVFFFNLSGFPPNVFFLNYYHEKTDSVVQMKHDVTTWLKCQQLKHYPSLGKHGGNRYTLKAGKQCQDLTERKIIQVELLIWMFSTITLLNDVDNYALKIVI